MWILKGPKEEIYFLLPGKHVVGRKGCNLILEGDQSISRTHATIEVVHPQKNLGDPRKPPTATVSDSSKYGTSLVSSNESQKLTSEARKLNSGDEIHFGCQWNKWKLCFEPLVVVMSSLTRQERHAVKSQIAKLGGHVVTEWSPDVTHLTMSSITMTVKAICALAYAKPIVSHGFWDSYVAAAELRSALPKYEDFVPPLNESNINKHEVSFLINPQRSSLFKGKVFAFFSELQFREHGCLVEAAGGEAEYVNSYIIKSERFLQPNIIVMLHLAAVDTQSTSSSQYGLVPPSYYTLCDALKAEGKRAIPSSEIGLAILHCSTEKFCNPEFSFTSMFLRSSEEARMSISKEKILATETQDVGDDFVVNSGIIIPDSGTESKIGEQLQTTEIICANEERPQASESQNSTEYCFGNRNGRRIESQSSTEHSIGNRSERRTRAAKRIIEESDDEEEVIPVKKTSYSDTPVSKSSGQAASTSKARARPKTTSEEMDDMFGDFQMAEPKGLTAGVSRVNGDEKDLFAGFESVSQRSPQPNSEVFSVPPIKRELSSDDENDGPPSKRLELAEEKPAPPLNSQHSVPSQMEQEFISRNIKEESVDQSSCNVSVIVMSLIVKKNLNISATTSASSVNENGKNFKKFRKVQHLSTLPRIIGEDDLEKYGSRTRVQNGIMVESSDSEEDGPGSLWHQITQSRRPNSKPSAIPSWALRR